ncbi:putative DNA-binding domain-containing protein [Legionella oakridgensis]|uniref:HvfC/BufC family peptide modification chaperone n=1 Tax=Legionella oakridgensis TaxID=29423 RepID=UPI0009DCB916
MHPERLLQVYRNNYYISLTEALENIYPLTQKLVGKDFLQPQPKLIFVAILLFLVICMSLAANYRAFLMISLPHKRCRICLK